MVVILFVQLYNWFPLDELPKVLAVLWFAIHSGYIFWINVDLEYNWVKYWTVSLIFLFFSVIDYLYFMSHPYHANIFVDDVGRSYDQKNMHDVINLAVKLRQATKAEISVYDL